MIVDRIRGLARVPGARLRAADENFRVHDARQRKVLKGLLAEVGIIGAVLVWVPDDMARAALRSSQDFGAWLSGYEGTFQLIDGHMRAEELKGQHIPVLVTDLSRAEASKALATFDAVGDLAGRDAQKLAALLEGVGRGSEEGTEELLAALRADDAAANKPTDPPTEADEAAANEVPERVEPRTKRGDIWLLGKHRLICGDCRIAADVDRLVNGAKVNVAFTSPPYASQRKYDESSGFKPIHPDAFVEWFADVQSNVARVLADDGSWFVNIKEHCDDGQRSLYVKDLTIAHVRTWGWRFVDELCWERGGVPGKWPNRFKNAWEPVFHFSQEREIRMRHENVSHPSSDVVSYDISNHKTHSGFLSSAVGGRQDGMALPSNVVVAHSHASQIADQAIKHTATFPVALPEFFIKAFSDPGDIIFDPFMGSGTTMIAAERNGRAGYGVELSPAYCDIIVARWEKFTGKTATLADAAQAAG